MIAPWDNGSTITLVPAVPADHPVEFSQANKANPMTKKLKDYGNGIMASDDRLASIGELYMREEMERQKQRALLRAAFRDGKAVEGQWGSWNISDRH